MSSAHLGQRISRFASSVLVLWLVPSVLCLQLVPDFSPWFQSRDIRCGTGTVPCAFRLSFHRYVWWLYCAGTVGMFVSSVGIALGYGLDDRCVLGFDSRRGLGIFHFSTASRTALGPAQPSIQWVVETLSLGVKRPGREADPSPPSSAKDKECVELYLHSPNTPSWRGVG
jgi:hypothetical protein